MDDHQRASWTNMLSKIAEYRSGTVHLGPLVANLRGLFIEADPHDPVLRGQFDNMWGPVDAEHELRTEPWAPVGAASDGGLERALDQLTDWVRVVLPADVGSQHN